MPPLIFPTVLQYLYQSACTDDLAAILCAKAHGGDINFVNVGDEGKTPMLIAIEKVYSVNVFLSTFFHKLPKPSSLANGALFNSFLKCYVQAC